MRLATYEDHLEVLSLFRAEKHSTCRTCHRLVFLGFQHQIKVDEAPKMETFHYCFHCFLHGDTSPEYIRKAQMLIRQAISN